MKKILLFLLAFYCTVALADVTGLVSPPGGSGGGGSMTWPGAAGIPCYSGSSSWCTSYTASNQIPPTYLLPTLVNGEYLTNNGTSLSWATPTGSGTVNSGTLGQTAYYAAAGTAVSGTSALILGASSIAAGDPVGLAGYATASLPTCNSTLKGSLSYTTDGTPALTFCNGSAWISQGGTTFTMAGTGCTPTAATGSATAGTFTLAAGPCTAVTVTFNGAVGMTAPNGWHCDVNDRTLQNAGTWFGEWGESATSTTTATIPIPSAAGATDVISFACTEY